MILLSKTTFSKFETVHRRIEPLPPQIVSALSAVSTGTSGIRLSLSFCTVKILNGPCQ
jgi:hypothetical protein